MVIRILSGGLNGDLGFLQYNYGFDDDTVYVAPEPTSYIYEIRSHIGADIIDLADENPLNQSYVYGGKGNDTVFGGKGIETVADQSGNDRYALGAGNDLFRDGKGNDRASGGVGRDTISFIFLTNDVGTSVANTVGVICDLAVKGVHDFGIFGHDRISSFENVIGGDGKDHLFGTNAANLLVGYGAGDLLVGRGGADTLDGRDGRDTLIGGSGGDELYLNEATISRDVVRYLQLSDSGVGLAMGRVDMIAFFAAGGGPTDDRIDLSAIDARRGSAGDDAFIFRGAGAFRSAAGEVRVATTGSDCVVLVDIDGDGASEMNILVQGVMTLTAGDFIL